MTEKNEIILIHGMGCGGDVWAPMQSALVAKGWRCAAPTLLAAQRPVSLPPSTVAREIALTDYVAETRAHCDAVTVRTGRKPIVIGHSMGGLIAQVLACEGACEKAACITPAPPAAIANRNPWALVLYANVLLSGKLNRYHKAWRFGVSKVLLNCVPKSLHARIYARMRYEPGQIFADMMRGLSVEPSHLAAPMLFVSAGRDRIVSAGVVAATAQHYRKAGQRTALRHYQGSGHWIIDEPENEEMIGDIVHWLIKKPQSVIYL